MGRYEVLFGAVDSATSSGFRVRFTANLSPRFTKKTAAVGFIPAVTPAEPLHVVATKEDGRSVVRMETEVVG